MQDVFNHKTTCTLKSFNVSQSQMRQFLKTNGQKGIDLFEPYLTYPILKLRALRKIDLNVQYKAPMLNIVKAQTKLTKHYSSVRRRKMNFCANILICFKFVKGITNYQRHVLIRGH